MIVPFDDKTNPQLKVRYVIVGIWNTIFGYLTFFVLDSILENVFIKRYFAYMCAMLLGQIIATINAFIFHKYITFKSKIKDLIECNNYDYDDMETNIGNSASTKGTECIKEENFLAAGSIKGE